MSVLFKVFSFISMSIAGAADLPGQDSEVRNRAFFFQQCSEFIGIKLPEDVIQSLALGEIPGHYRPKELLARTQYWLLTCNVEWLTRYTLIDGRQTMLPYILPSWKSLKEIVCSSSSLRVLPLDGIGYLTALTHLSFKGSSSLNMITIDAENYLNKDRNYMLIRDSLMNLITKLPNLVEFDLTGTGLANFQDDINQALQSRRSHSI